MKKKLICCLFAALLCAALFCACGNTGSNAEKESKLKVVTTVFATYDLVQQLAERSGVACDVKMLLAPGGESHAYEPSPADVAAIQSCDMFIYIGGTSEAWADKLIASSRTGKCNLRMFDTVRLLEEEEVEGMEPEHDHDHGDHDHDHEEAEVDEHIWTSPRNASMMLAYIAAQMKNMLPDNAEKISAAEQEIQAELEVLDKEACDIRDNCPKHTLVFADRFPFRYLTHEYGWDYYAAFAGCSSDTDASAATLSFLIQKVKDENIHTVFYLENSSQKISDAVCKATDAKAVMMQSLNNVSREDFESGKHYQDYMRENLTAIREALS